MLAIPRSARSPRPAALLAACGGADPLGSDEPKAEVVPEGNDDNYQSLRPMEHGFSREG